MNTATPALLAAAAGVGLGHAILPDHWVPLAVVGRTRRYKLSRVARLATLAGIAHVLVSLLLGGVIIVVGLQLRSAVEGAQDTIIGCVLILTGVGFALVELTGHGHHHHGGHDKGHGESDAEQHRLPSPAETDALIAERESGIGGWAAVMIPFGAAASPDLTILPVFLAATAAGTATAVASLLVFAAATIGTIVSLTLLACFGGYQFQGDWLERWGNALTALALIGIGVLILTGVI